MQVTMQQVIAAVHAIYDRGFRFGQDYLYLAGGMQNGEWRDGIQEKVDRLQRGDNTMDGPGVNAGRVLGEGHHLVVALQILGMLEDSDLWPPNWGKHPLTPVPKGSVRILGRNGALLCRA